MSPSIIRDLMRLSTKFNTDRAIGFPYEIDISLDVAAPTTDEARAILDAIGTAMSLAADKELTRLRQKT